MTAHERIARRVGMEPCDCSANCGLWVDGVLWTRELPTYLATGDRPLRYVEYLLSGDVGRRLPGDGVVEIRRSEGVYEAAFSPASVKRSGEHGEGPTPADAILALAERLEAERE